MKLYFIGGLYHARNINEVQNATKGMSQFAANELQKSIINGIVDNGLKIEVISLPFIPSYPLKYKKIFSPSYFKVNGFINISYFNLFPFNLISKFIVLITYILNNVKDKDCIFIVYSLHTPLLLATIIFKLLNKKCKICAIVPDLPVYMFGGKSTIYRILKRIDWNIVKMLLVKIDSFVLVSSYMKEALKIKSKPNVIIEGIFDSRDKTDHMCGDKFDVFTFFYAGSLNQKYGIIELLRVFSKIKNDNIRLLLCGSGDAVSVVNDFQKRDKRILYLGVLQHDEVFKLERKSHILVNPRMSVEEFTKYSFPSKTMEFLASGTPAILFKLPGIPNEYYPYAYFIDGGEDNLYAMMSQVINIPLASLEQFGLKARRFILQNKNPKKTTEKILSMLCLETRLY